MSIMVVVYKDQFGSPVSFLDFYQDLLSFSSYYKAIQRCSKLLVSEYETKKIPLPLELVTALQGTYTDNSVFNQPLEDELVRLIQRHKDFTTKFIEPVLLSVTSMADYRRAHAAALTAGAAAVRGFEDSRAEKERLSLIHRQARKQYEEMDSARQEVLEKLNPAYKHFRTVEKNLERIDEYLAFIMELYTVWNDAKTMDRVVITTEHPDVIDFLTTGKWVQTNPTTEKVSRYVGSEVCRLLVERYRARSPTREVARLVRGRDAVELTPIDDAFARAIRDIRALKGRTVEEKERLHIDICAKETGVCAEIQTRILGGGPFVDGNLKRAFTPGVFENAKKELDDAQAALDVWEQGFFRMQRSYRRSDQRVLTADANRDKDFARHAAVELYAKELWVDFDEGAGRRSLTPEGIEKILHYTHSHYFRSESEVADGPVLAVVERIQFVKGPGIRFLSDMCAQLNKLSDLWQRMGPETGERGFFKGVVSRLRGKGSLVGGDTHKKLEEYLKNYISLANDCVGLLYVLIVLLS